VRTPGDWTTRLLDVPTVESRFQVDRLHLVKSTLTPGGAHYEPLVEGMLVR
jgi:2'-5' RNA ligase